MRDFCLDNLDVSLDQGILDTHKGSFGHLLIAVVILVMVVQA